MTDQWVIVINEGYMRFIIPVSFETLNSRF